jgi:hypothetical protein
VSLPDPEEILALTIPDGSYEITPARCATCTRPSSSPRVPHLRRRRRRRGRLVLLRRPEEGRDPLPGREHLVEGTGGRDRRVLGYVLLLDALPKTATEKVRKPVLAEAWEKAEGVWDARVPR